MKTKGFHIYALPPMVDPKLMANAKLEITINKAKMYSAQVRKPFKLEYNDIYPRTSPRAARKQVGLILYHGYFEYRFRLLIPTLMNNLFKYWRKSLWQLTPNAYTHLSVIETLGSVNFRSSL